MVCFNSKTGKVVYKKPDAAALGAHSGYQGADQEPTGVERSNAPASSAGVANAGTQEPDAERRPPGVAASRRSSGIISGSASAGRCNSKFTGGAGRTESGPSRAASEAPDFTGDKSDEDVVDLRVWNVMPDEMYLGWKIHLWKHLLEAARSRMPPKPVPPAKSVTMEEGAWYKLNNKYKSDRDEYPKRCRDRILDLKREIQELQKDGKDKRSHAIFETELLDKPYSTLCCGSVLYSMCAALCLNCNASVRRYEKARMRDAVREWLQEARIESRSRVKGPGGLRRLKREKKKKDNIEAESSAPSLMVQGSDRA